MSAEALHGDLGHFMPSDVLQLLQLAQCTGRLELRRGAEHAQIVLMRGRPVLARTTGASVRAGEVLVHRGELRPEALERALAEQRSRPEVRLGALLAAAGEVTPEQVRLAVRDVVRRVIVGVLLWKEGSFRFVPGAPPVEDDLEIDLDLDRLILEGMRLADESRAVRS